jgi:uncharacterized protein YbjT (DUF2867 family)
MILVTGASGLVGGAVLKAVVKAGAQVRAMYRSEQEARKAPAGTATVVADFADTASLRKALQGIRKVFLVCGAVPELIDLETRMIAACKEARVAHVVQNSAFGAGSTNSSFPSWHFQVEQAMRNSGLSYTILRPESFMQNIVTYFAGTIRTQNAFFSSMRAAPIALIDVRDIGSVAAQLLTSDGHSGKIYSLTGTEAVTYDEVAARLSKLTGRQIRYVDLPPAEQEKALRGLGMPEWQVRALLELQAFYTGGPGSKVSPDVRAVLGRDPISFDQFLSDNAAAFSPATSA